MKRILFSFVSFHIFILEFIVNLFFLAGIVFNHIYHIFLVSWIRYHNRIQMYMGEKKCLLIIEVKNET